MAVNTGQYPVVIEDQYEVSVKLTFVKTISSTTSVAAVRLEVRVNSTPTPVHSSRIVVAPSLTGLAQDYHAASPVSFDVKKPFPASNHSRQNTL